MQNSAPLHLVKVKYHGATNTKSARVSLTSQRFPADRVSFSYDHEFNSATDQAEKWLQEAGYTIIGFGEAPDIVGFFAVADFKPLQEMKPSTRKTRDVWEVQGNYGESAGWECVTCEDTRREALQRLKEYRENETGVPFRLKMTREKIATN